MTQGGLRRYLKEGRATIKGLRGLHLSSPYEHHLEQNMVAAAGV